MFRVLSTLKNTIKDFQIWHHWSTILTTDWWLRELTDSGGAGDGGDRGRDREPMSQSNAEDPEGLGGADGSGDWVGDPERCGGARMTEDQGGAGGKDEQNYRFFKFWPIVWSKLSIFLNAKNH